MPSDSRLLLRTDRFQVVEVANRGASGEVVRRPIVRHPGAVVILPEVDERHLCLIRNYRVSVDRTLLELPAGTRDPDEPPERTAARELVEETGYRAERLERLRTFYTAPGVLDEQMHLYLAQGLHAGQAAREAGEEIENQVLPWQEAVRLALDGTIEDAKTLVGLLLYDRLRREQGR